MNFFENDDLDRFMELEAQSEERETWARAEFGDDWREREDTLENRRFVDYSDVYEPDTFVIWGYGSDHRVLIPSA